jgi:hypothetical protein
MVGGERRLELCHGFDLALAQPLRQQRRHRLQPLAIGNRVGETAP